MSNFKRRLIGLMAISLLGLPLAPQRAAAQASTKTYQVTVTNITNSKQGLSPLVIATHPASVHGWQMGQVASKGTALLAREGMPDLLASELKPNATDVQVTHAHLLPGDSITVTITAKDGDTISAATMLIETNDGFTGLDAAALTDGNTETMAYDAGAEDNTEAAADVPGPPFGGKNHGPDTNPPQPISAHPGIQGKADVPAADFNWSGPVARFTIKAVDANSVSPAPPAYEVTVTNITNSMQGLSPLVVATHPASVHGWQMGQIASKGTALLAREGMPAMLASELKAAGATDVATTNAHLLPGDSITVRVSAKQGDTLSAATMLIQTNDGFTGLDAVALTNGNTDTNAYDAGAEDNTEAAADVPGPPFGGKNHGPDTNPPQPISAHPGIQGKADVTAPFQWSGPVARFTIKTLSSSALPSVGSPAGSPTGSTTGSTAGSTAGSTTGSMTSAPSTGTTEATSGSMPGMPHTGVPDFTIWVIAGLAAALALAGLGLRRRGTVHVR